MPATATATTLSFTGVGSVWTTSFGVLGLLFLGSLLMMRRRVSRAPHA